MRHSIFFSLFLFTSIIYAATPQQESQGVESQDDGSASVISIDTPANLSRIISGSIPTDGVLLIPESTNDRIMAFDPATGNLIDADYIPSDPTHLSTPICAILSADGASILVSDQINDVVQQYDLNGAYVGVFAPAGGVDNAILDNIRGIALRPNGNLLVTVGGGTNADAIAEFDTNGVYLGNFIAPGASPMSSPFDVFVRSTDILVGGINSDAIHRYDLNGAYIDDFAAVDTFPEQVATAPSNNNLLVANFSGTQVGVIEYNQDGSILVDVYNPATLGGGNRGVYELPNGNILTSNGNGVHEITRAGVFVESKITGVSARYIELVTPPQNSTGSSGGCSYSTQAKFDPLLPLMILLSFVYLFRKKRGIQ